MRRVVTLVVLMSSVLLEPTVGTAAVECPSTAEPVTKSILWNSGLREVSGIQTSVDHPGVVWVIEDSGNGPYLYAFDRDGNRLATYRLEGRNVRNVDWEAIGLDHRAGTDLLYIGDIGDNRGVRNGADRPVPVLYGIEEPNVSPGGAPIEDTITKIQRYPFRYFARTDSWQMSPKDAESMFVDPRTHNVFVVLKDLKTLAGTPKMSRVFEIKDQDLVNRSLNHAVDVTAVVGAGDGVGTGPVAADISPDGVWIVVKNYKEGFLWRRARRQSVIAVLSQNPVAPCAVPVDSAEAVAFDQDGGSPWTGILSLREARSGNPPLNHAVRLWP